MTKVGKCDEFCDNIKSDYAMLICENLTVEKEVYARNRDICKCWSSMSKNKDVRSEAKLIKCSLKLSHENSIPEIEFSVNNNIV